MVTIPQGKRLKASMDVQKEILQKYFLAKVQYICSVHVTKELNQQGINVSRTTVALHIEKIKLRSEQSKKFKNLSSGVNVITIVLDLFDRKIIRWSTSDGMTTEENGIDCI